MEGLENSRTEGENSNYNHQGNAKLEVAQAMRESCVLPVVTMGNRKALEVGVNRNLPMSHECHNRGYNRLVTILHSFVELY